jgi:hypothetical protein
MRRMVHAGKRVVDVEDAVAWACDELTKRRHQARPYDLSKHDASLVGRWTRPPGFPEVAPMFRSAVAGGWSASTAGSSWDRARAPRAAGAPDPDALRIEEAIAALPEALMTATAPDELAIDLGFALDVEGAFEAARGNVVNIVRVCGALRKRPVFWVESPIPSPVIAANGKPAVMRIALAPYRAIDGETKRREAEVAAQRLRSNLCEEGAYCKLTYDPDPQFVVNARAEYLVWRLALGLLAEALAGELDRFAVIEPGAPLAPWLGERDAAKPPDLMAPGAVGVYSAIEILSLEARRANRDRRRPAFRPQDARRPTRPGRSVSGDGEAS